MTSKAPPSNPADALDASRSGRKPYLVYLIAMVAAVGGFLFGYDLAIISGAMIFLRQEFALTPDQIGFATGSALLGCMVGPIVSGTLSDLLGRKRTLILAGLLFASGALGTALCRASPSLVSIESWAGWAWGSRRSSRPCTSPRWRPHASGGDWWP
jgi:MFS family permease